MGNLGMLSALPPGMAGYVLADQQRGQRQAQQLQSLGMLSQLQNADIERQLLPLKMKELQAKAQEAETMGSILQRYMAARGGVAPGAAAMSAGAAQGDVGPTVTNAARIGQPTAQANPFQLPPDVELALLHPRLAPLGKVQAEAFKPTDKVREAIALGYQPGTPQFAAFVGTQYNQGGAWQPDGQGGVRLAPGYAQGMGEVRGAEERAKAQFDLVTTPPLSPTSPPTRGSRLQALEGAGAMPAPAVAPTPMGPRPNTGTRANVPTADQARILAAEAQRQLAETGTVDPALQAEMGRYRLPVPSNAAGMSPMQEVEVATRKTWQELTTKDHAKIYSELNNASMKNPSKIAKFEQIGKLLEDFEGGKLSGAGFELARLGNSVGLKVDTRLGNKEAAAAMANEMALDLRSTGDGAGMPGALSDADREFLKSMTPQMASSAEGRKQVINARTTLWRREMEVAGKARAYVKKYGSLDQDFFSQLSQWSERNPAFKR
jgi:hypothetical protein